MELQDRQDLSRCKAVLLGAEFMAPYWRPELDVCVQIPLALFRDDPARARALLAEHADARFAYAMNTAGPDARALPVAARLCRELGLACAWHTIEDPNSHQTFLDQGQGFDLVATSDAELLDRYRQVYPGARTLWLPLAAQPALHSPAPLHPDAADFVISANWYEGEERLEGVRRVVEPLVDAGRSLALFSYARCRWPDKYWRHWRGETSCYAVGGSYPAGRIALGLNNQTRATAMTSMRTFEALACGKPLLAAASDAYPKLGFVQREHFVWSDAPERTLALVAELERAPEQALAMAERGRAFVLAHHTYAQRLQTLRQALGV